MKKVAALQNSVADESAATITEEQAAELASRVQVIGQMLAEREPWRLHYPAVWIAVLKRFEIARARDLPRGRYREALDWLDLWTANLLAADWGYVCPRCGERGSILLQMGAEKITTCLNPKCENSQWIADPSQDLDYVTWGHLDALFTRLGAHLLPKGRMGLWEAFHEYRKKHSMESAALLEILRDRWKDPGEWRATGRPEPNPPQNRAEQEEYELAKSYLEAKRERKTTQTEFAEREDVNITARTLRNYLKKWRERGMLPGAIFLFFRFFIFL